MQRKANAHVQGGHLSGAEACLVAQPAAGAGTAHVQTLQTPNCHHLKDVTVSEELKQNVMAVPINV